MAVAEIIAIKNKQNYDLLSEFSKRRLQIHNYLCEYIEENFIGKVLKKKDETGVYAEILGVVRKDPDDRLASTYPVQVIANIRTMKSKPSKKLFGFSHLDDNCEITLHIQVNSDSSLDIVGYEPADDIEYQEFLTKFGIDQHIADKNGKRVMNGNLVRTDIDGDNDSVICVLHEYDYKTKMFTVKHAFITNDPPGTGFAKFKTDYIQVPPDKIEYFKMNLSPFTEKIIE